MSTDLLPLTTLTEIQSAAVIATSERELRRCWDAARAMGCQADGVMGQAIRIKAQSVGADSLATELVHRASADVRAREA